MLKAELYRLTAEFATLYAAVEVHCTAQEHEIHLAETFKIR